MNCTSFTFADIFSGIGGVRLGFEGAGGTCVFSSETEAAGGIFPGKWEKSPLPRKGEDF